MTSLLQCVLFNLIEFLTFDLFFLITFSFFIIDFRKIFKTFTGIIRRHHGNPLLVCGETYEYFQSLNMEDREKITSIFFLFHKSIKNYCTARRKFSTFD